MTPRRLAELLSTGFRLPTYQTLTGITHNTVYVVTTVLKAGPVVDIELEAAIYADLEAQLGDRYYEIFPPIVLRDRDEDSAVIEVAWLGHTLNEIVFRPLVRGDWTTVFADDPAAQPVVEKLRLADRVIGKALGHLDTMFRQTQRKDAALSADLVDETLEALRVNLVRAGLRSKLDADFGRILAARDLWIRDLRISCCHRDLMVEQIYVADLDGDLTVKFADPRPVLPHCDAGIVRRVPVTCLGNIALDLAHLELSLTRRELELQRFHPDFVLSGLDLVRKRVATWIGQGRFTAAFYDLAMATWYANYSGWPPALGTEPPPGERWLYEAAVASAVDRVGRCGSRARGGDVEL